MNANETAVTIIENSLKELEAKLARAKGEKSREIEKPEFNYRRIDRLKKAIERYEIKIIAHRELLSSVKGALLIQV